MMNMVAIYVVDVNLIVVCGDFDLGDIVGLVYKDILFGIVKVEYIVCFNMCDYKLGVFDVELMYDKDVFFVLEVKFYGVIVGQMFNVNWKSEFGKIFINGVMSISSNEKGNVFGLFKVVFNLNKGGDFINEMVGTIKLLVVLDGVMVIGGVIL